MIIRCAVLSSLSFLKIKLLSLFTVGMLRTRPLEGPTREALTPLPFIDDQHLPPRLLLEHGGEVLRVCDCFISGYKDVEACQFVGCNAIPSFGLAIEGYNADLWRPALELAHPVGNGRIGNDDKCRECIPFLDDSAQERRDLYSFALRTYPGSALVEMARRDVSAPNPFHRRGCSAGGSTSYCRAS